jgi:hypothetical protein
VCVGTEPTVALGIQVRTPAVILGILSFIFTGVVLSERVVGKAMAVSNQSRQSADSAQPGQLVRLNV